MEKTDAWQMIRSSVDYCRLALITLGVCICFGTLHETSYKIHVACSQIGKSHQFKPVFKWLKTVSSTFQDLEFDGSL